MLYVRARKILLLLTLSVGISMAGQTAPRAADSPQQSPAEVFADAQHLSQQGKYDEAIAELQQLKARVPPPKGLEHELGVAYYKKGDYQAASVAFETALKENPDDSEAIQLLGLSYYLGGKPQQAIPLLEKVQTWYPRANVDGSYILGICYIQSKRYDDARHAFAKMFDVPPDSASGYLFTARMLFRQEYNPVAEEYAQKSVALDPRLPLAHFLLGEIHLYKSQIPEAIADLKQELALNPSYAPGYYKLADAYLRNQKFDDAERLLQRSIWLDATSTGPYILLGKVLEKKGEPVLAVRALQRAVKMDPNNPMTHQLLGQAYREIGQAELAARELERVEQLNAAAEANP
ncbi:MAG TPA: tetratricopeptide repeat protein [Terriglobales bacterium]|nr:tetratricopeptide repeat protein [Terriglobales bacterium]